jgi:predicted nucleic acid-binding protein
VAIVICNASPLIVLAKAGYLDVLNNVFERVLAPAAVKKEILAGPAEDPARIALERGFRIEIVKLEPEITPLAYWRLGRGETEVLEYARLHPGTVALLDDLDRTQGGGSPGDTCLGHAWAVGQGTKR